MPEAKFSGDASFQIGPLTIRIIGNPRVDPLLESAEQVLNRNELVDILSEAVYRAMQRRDKDKGQDKSTGHD